jgi:hypothetical protein
MNNIFLAVVAEVELFWCSSEEKQDIKNNPDYVYYIADKAKYEEQNKRLMNEYKVYYKRTNDSTERNSFLCKFLFFLKKKKLARIVNAI